MVDSLANRIMTGFAAYTRGNRLTEALQTTAVHGGYDQGEHFHAANTPIYASAAFDMVNAERGDALSSGALPGFSYSRVANPTVDVLERRLAALEGGASAVAVASGMAAVSFALLCAAEGGGRIIAPTDLYGASVDAMETFFPNFGVSTDFVRNINDLAEVEAAITDDTRCIFAESVSNPSIRITDVEALARLAHRHGIPLIIDNTVPTPYLFRPIEFGADIVVHSTTKGITGHGNAVGGVVIDSGRFDWSNGRFPQFLDDELAISDERNNQWRSFVDAFGDEAFINRIRIKYLRTFGAVASPFNAYLSLVGLETLPQRLSQQVASAKAIAQRLANTPHVLAVNYPGFGDDPQTFLSSKYYPNGVGGVLSFLVDGDESNVRRILDGTHIFEYIPNIGDSRSLIVDPARITHREVPARYRLAAGVTDNLIRLSIGLEDTADLIDDLIHAIGEVYA